MIAPLVIKGYKFFNSETGENILIKGIDYYPRPNTGILDANSIDFFTGRYRHIWERDIIQFQALGVNAVRLYAVDPKEDHSAFMCALDSAGMYALIELASGACPQSRCAISSKEVPDCYPRELKRRGETIIREFSLYTNTLAFSAGNEVNHFVPLGKPPEWNAPCLKKFVRDMRAYTKSCHHMRHVPMGLIMADSDRDENTLYYNCQSNPRDDLDHAEWYGINTYVYCDGAAEKYEDAKGFETLQKSFDSYNYSIPVLLTEFGCLSKTFPTSDGYQAQRNFNQAKWLSLPKVQKAFSGGLVFEYSIEASNAHTPFPYKVFGNQNYGVGYFAPAECDDITIMCHYERTPSFYNLKNAYEGVKSDSNITLESFVPEKDRRGRSSCPSKFPALHSFKWETDYVLSIECPTVSEQVWSCGSLSGHDVVEFSDNISPLFTAMALGLFGGILGLLISIKKIGLVLPRCVYWNREDEKADDAAGAFKEQYSNYMSIDSKPN